ncbi:MAG TPA: tetratricopeptide repeat protein [Blastocatellia bacterium]|nr:tetratricopeptide repeat protein [Blastocatellia bacterium]
MFPTRPRNRFGVRPRLVLPRLHLLCAWSSAALDQARAYTGDSPDLWNNIGEVYFMLERFPQALAAYDMARRKLPGYYPACYGKARSHLMLGQKTEAREACREYLAAAEAKDPLVPTIQRMLALCD